MKKHSRCNTARKFLLFWCLFIGVGALLGSSCMLIKPDGSIMQMQGLLPYFQVLPFADVLFQDYVFPGIALLCVNGLPNFIAAYLLIKRRKAGLVLGGILGLTLMLWICIQFVIFPMNFMSTTYFIFGLAQALTGYGALTFYKQELFSVNMEDYPNIGTNDRELVVFFSRMGYTRKIACETANASGARLYEVRSTELTEGTRGFWWCGRYGMHRWEMPIEDIAVDLTAFDRVTICSPVWVFELSAPMRSFCKKAAGKIKRADYIVVHHTGNTYQNAAREMDALLGTEHCGFRSIRCRKGDFKTIV